MELERWRFRWRGVVMDTNGLLFLVVVMVGGVLIVTLFFYGGHFVLRLLETTDRSYVPGYGQTVAVHSDSTPGASTLKRVGAADPGSAVLRL